MDGGRYLARSARHASIGNKRDLDATILKDAQSRCELVKFWHANSPWALKADGGDEVGRQLTSLESILEALLGVEDPCGCLDETIFRLYGGNLDDRFAQITREQL